MKMMYYPFVDPPQPVLWQALLYWDELTSICPEAGYQLRHDLMVLTKGSRAVPADSCR